MKLKEDSKRINDRFFVFNKFLKKKSISKMLLSELTVKTWLKVAS